MKPFTNEPLIERTPTQLVEICFDAKIPADAAAYYLVNVLADEFYAEFADCSREESLKHLFRVYKTKFSLYGKNLGLTNYALAVAGYAAIEIAEVASNEN